MNYVFGIWAKPTENPLNDEGQWYRGMIGLVEPLTNENEDPEYTIVGYTSGLYPSINAAERGAKAVLDRKMREWLLPTAFLVHGEIPVV